MINILAGANSLAEKNSFAGQNNFARENSFTGKSNSTEKDNITAQPSYGTGFKLGNLHGKRILIVDDNEANRKLIQWLLEKQSAEFDAVENGQQAVDAYMQINYDLVLMDVNMPVMDGLEATNQIRAFEQSSLQRKFRRTPIIALTANIMVGDKEHFVKAGMDDCLIKPLDKQILLRIIGKWCGIAIPVSYSVNSIDHFDADDAAWEPVTGITLPVVDAKLGIELSAGDADNWREMLGMLLQQLPHYSASLIEAVNNMDHLKQISHKLAGASSYCGTPALHHAAKQLELVCRLSESVRVHAALSNLQFQIQRLKKSGPKHI